MTADLKHVLVYGSGNKVTRACKISTAELMQQPEAVIWSKDATCPTCPTCIERCDLYNIAIDIGEAFDGSR